ncbi:hypothetical protein Tco_0797863 [Tanacetum coccineum]
MKRVLIHLVWSAMGLGFHGLSMGFGLTSLLSFQILYYELSYDIMEVTDTFRIPNKQARQYIDESESEEEEGDTEDESESEDGQGDVEGIVDEEHIVDEVQVVGKCPLVEAVFGNDAGGEALLGSDGSEEAWWW